MNDNVLKPSGQLQMTPQQVDQLLPNMIQDTLRHVSNQKKTEAKLHREKKRVAKQEEMNKQDQAKK